MHNINFESDTIGVLGFGVEGSATLDFLANAGARHVSLLDANPALEISPAHAALVSDCILGPHYLKALETYDVIIKSPGIPFRLIPQSIRHRVTSATNIFLSLHKDKTIGITGTKGKSTTSSLISHLLSTGQITNKLIGNIGVPALSAAEENVSTFIFELSSYQLELLDTSPHGAVLLNLYPEHLDHHGNLERYFDAKHKIHKFQTSSDYVVIPSDLTDLSETKSLEKNRRIFGSQNSTAWLDGGVITYMDRAGAVHSLCRTDELLIVGPGNHHNALAALSAIQHFDIPPSLLIKALLTFKPLPHRLEPVEVDGGITFINDSISTVPQATLNALETFSLRAHTLILGGFDRGVSFDSLVDYITTSNVRLVLLLPPSGERLKSTFEVSQNFNPERLALVSVQSLEEAVKIAKAKTPKDHVCLLSPAAPSFPMFRDFTERGCTFKRLVQSESTPTGA
jgi:UDP-N-acetylmuramoylalanine--D-glutamate ligase